jgi:hypothetical protein
MIRASEIGTLWACRFEYRPDMQETRTMSSSNGPCPTLRQRPQGSERQEELERQPLSTNHAFATIMLTAKGGRS